ncbi:helix-turn-helix domain-containing protein [Streptomyces sp. NPDC047017]|uniref:helix-turn-helix domain-containing protein n=1 Tax=Streptomyces sp. NPDC047017 TaxID=3155024 RepID=UPI0033C6A333
MSVDDQVLALLRLLHEEAPMSRFDELEQGVRGKGGDRRAAGLAEAVGMGRRIRLASGQRRAREAGLVALVDAARDLTAARDQESLLDVITRHTRRLLGLDVAYLSFRHPPDSTLVRACVGGITPLPPDLEGADDAGRRGLERSQGAPVWSPDYLNDEAVTRDETLDDLVRREGLHAIAAVSLGRHGTVHGTLAGASRQVRYFTPEEISLFASFADLAAAAIDRVAAVDRARGEAAARAAERARAEAVLDRTRRLWRAQIELAPAALADDAPQALADGLGRALRASVQIRDAHGEPLTDARDTDEPDMDGTGSAYGTGRADGTGRAYGTGSADNASSADSADASPGTGSPAARHPDETTLRAAALDAHAGAVTVVLDDGTHVVPLISGTDRLGVLVLAGHPGPDEDELLLLQGAAAACAQVLARRGAAGAAGPAGPGRQELFEDLLVGTSWSPRQLADRAALLGLDPTAPHVLVVARPDAGERTRTAVWATSYAQRGSGHRSERDDHVVLLLPGSDASAAARAVAAELEPLLSGPVTVGAAGPERGPQAVARLHARAVRCVEALTALHGPGGVASTRDLGFLGMLLSADHDVDGFVRSVLGPVLRYDAQRLTDLAATMSAYFEAGGSPTGAARSLHVHPNTVTRRLERITELLGAGWQSLPRALDVQLALRLRAVGAALTGGAPSRGRTRGS